MRLLDQLRGLELHVVSQVVETQFVVRRVCDVGQIRRAAGRFVNPMLNDSHPESQEIEDLPHPLRVALSQIVVHRDHMNALASKRVQIGRQRCNQRLAFTGFHFRDAALMQGDAADQLHVEMAHLEGALARLAPYGECLGQKGVQALPVFDTLLEFGGFELEFFVGEVRNRGLQFVDRDDLGLDLLDLAVASGTHELLYQTVEHY